MKPAYEWDWDYIQTLPIGEFDWLEAKGLGGLPGQAPKIEDSKVREMLAKVVSAFANTGGGQFIWGVKDPDTAKGWVVENGGIPALYGKRATGDWLEDIIPNLMDAPLRGFNVYTVREAEGLAEDHVLFVIDVKDSSLAPHQNTWDNKYYGRVGGKSKPLNHRFVMDIIGRRQNPKLELHFDANPEINQLRGLPGRKHYIINLDVKLTNVGRVICKFPAVEIIDAPRYSSFRFEATGFGINGNNSYILQPKPRSRNPNSRIYGGGADDVIYPGQTIDIDRYILELSGEEAVKVGSVKIDYKVYADGFSDEGALIVVLEPILQKPPI